MSKNSPHAGDKLQLSNSRNNSSSTTTNNNNTNNTQFYESPMTGMSSHEFGNWQDTDLNDFLSDPGIHNGAFLSTNGPGVVANAVANAHNSNNGASALTTGQGDSNALISGAVSSETSASHEPPHQHPTASKFFHSDSHTSPPFNIRSPAEILYYQQNAANGSTENISSQLGLQIPPRFQASIAAAQLVNNNGNGGNGVGVGPGASVSVGPGSGSSAGPGLNQPFLDSFQPTHPPDSLTTGKPSKPKKKDTSTTVRTKIRPCEFCRRRKTKCIPIPNSASCQQCSIRGTQCTYSNPKKPDSDPSAKRTKYIVDELHPPPTVPIREVDPVQDYSVMPGYSLLKRTLSLQYPRSSFYIGPSSIYDPVLLNKIQFDKVDQVQLNQTTSLRKVAPNVQFTLKDDYTEKLYEMTERNVDAVERFVAPHGKILIELYFRIVHPSFPVLHKKVFLEKYSRTHREFSAPLLAAVYSLAIQWWDYDPQLSQFPKPNVVSLQKLAMQSFSFVIERPKLSAVQAGLLLLQCRGDNSRNWALCSQVVALAEELGLGLDCADWRLPKWERGLRRRLAWAVYLQDKWLSLIESRPSHIIEDRNWSVNFVTDEDFPERSNEPDSTKEGSTDIDNGKLLFKEMISLSQILSQILDTLFSMSAMRELTRIDQVLKAAKPLQLKLRQWYHSLPNELQLNAVQPRKLNSNGYLQLLYFAAEITLHRKIITSLNPSNPVELVQVCRTAARTRLLAAIEFVRSLKPEHIHSFWHSSATANFTLIGTFAAILFVTSPTAEEANLYKDQVYNYRWILRVSAKGFDQAGAALDQLDTILFHIPGLFNTTESHMTSLNASDLKRELSATPTPQLQEMPKGRKDDETLFPEAESEQQNLQQQQQQHQNQQQSHQNQPQPQQQQHQNQHPQSQSQPHPQSSFQLPISHSRSNSNVSQNLQNLQNLQSFSNSNPPNPPTQRNSPYTSTYSPLNQVNSPLSQKMGRPSPSNSHTSAGTSPKNSIHMGSVGLPSPLRVKKEGSEFADGTDQDSDKNGRHATVTSPLANSVTSSRPENNNPQLDNL